jgi:hypothetical protein
VPTAKRAKVWDRDAELGKAARTLQKKLELVAEAGAATMERAAKLVEGMTPEEKCGLVRPLETQQARLGLLAAMVWAIDVVAPVELPTAWEASDEDKAAFKLAREPLELVKTLDGKLMTDKGTVFCKELADKAKDIFAFGVFTNTQGPDYLVANAVKEFYAVGEASDLTLNPATAKDFIDQLNGIARCASVRIKWKMAREVFVASKASQPVADLSTVQPVSILKHRINTFTATSEHDLKDRDRQLKADIDFAKELFDRIKSSVTLMSQALSSHQGETARKAKQQDKARTLEEKKKHQSQKDALKSVRQLCKDSTSPGLLSYCGPLIKEITRFESVASFTDAAKHGKVDLKSPYVVEDCTTLKELADAAVTRTNFANFRAQLPHSDPISKKKKAQCPYLGGAEDKVKSGLLELTTSQRVPMDAVLSMWGCKSDMMQAGLEHGGLGNLRFTAKGAREIACCHVKELWSLVGGLKKHPVELSEKMTMFDVIEDTLLSDFTETGLQMAEEAGMKAFRGVSGSGSVIFIPAGFVVVERGIGSDMVVGWRLQICEDPDVIKSVGLIKTLLEGYTSGEKNSMLKSFHSAEGALAKAAAMQHGPSGPKAPIDEE